MHRKRIVEKCKKNKNEKSEENSGIGLAEKFRYFRISARRICFNNFISYFVSIFYLIFFLIPS